MKIQTTNNQNPKPLPTLANLTVKKQTTPSQHEKQPRVYHTHRTPRAVLPANNFSISPGEHTRVNSALRAHQATLARQLADDVATAAERSALAGFRKRAARARLAAVSSGIANISAVVRIISPGGLAHCTLPYSRDNLARARARLHSNAQNFISRGGFALCARASRREVRFRAIVVCVSGLPGMIAFNLAWTDACIRIG